MVLRGNGRIKEFKGEEEALFEYMYTLDPEFKEARMRGLARAVMQGTKATSESSSIST
jgi:hypothetical protein